MSFAINKATFMLLDSYYSAACKNLRAVPCVGSGPMGLTPDEVKMRPDYRIAKTEHDRALAALREFNAVYVKRFKKELAAERKAKRAERGIV